MPGPYRPTSVRVGLRQPDPLTADIPAHMRSAIAEWLRIWLDNYDTETGTMAAQFMNLGHVPSATHWGMSRRTGNHEQVRLSDRDSLLQFIRGDSEASRVLDILGAALVASRTESPREISQLRSILEQGGSKWTVGPDGRSIEARVNDTEADSYLAAIKPGDAASRDLAEAWRNAFGIRPDSSDAWDHAIKAVEWLLPAITAPDELKPTLGRLLSVLRDKPEKWEFKLDTADRQVTPVRTMIAMLGLVWGNPDRHGAGSSRPPTQKEAEAVVRMTVAVVGLLRAGTLARK